MNAQETFPPEPKVKSATIDTIEEAVSEHPFVKGMTRHQIRLLSDCAILERLPAHGLIFREGDPANRCYLIQKGKVAIESYVKDKCNTVIETVGPGEVLGWSWLFPPYFFHFNARALEPTEVICFYTTPLREECEDDHELGYELLKRITGTMLRRLQATRWQLLGLPVKG